MDTGGDDGGVVLVLGVAGESHPHPEDEHHGRQQGGPVLDAAHHLAEGVRERERDGEGEPDVEQVGERRRVLQGVGQVDVEEPTTVGPELHDGTHESGRATGDGLGDAVQRIVDRDRPGQGLHGAGADDDDAGEEGDGEEDVEHAPGDVDPEVADRRRVPAGEAPRPWRSPRRCRRPRSRTAAR